MCFVPRRRRLLGLTGLATATVASATIVAVDASSHMSHAPSSPPKSVVLTCPSPALDGSLPAVVYLPAGYAGTSTRFPVVYFLHGLPAGPGTYKTNAFVADAVADSGRRAIVVAPQGARSDDSDREYLNWSSNENWPGAIAGDLVHCVDARFRTIPKRTGRALIGLSAGGFGAFNIGLRRLNTFAAVESWSGYFVATNPSGLATLDLGSAQANRRARVPRGPRLNHRLTRVPAFVGFYVGNQDQTFLNANIALDRAFTAHGITHLFKIYPGGHSEALWQQWAPLWLGYALDYLTSRSHS